MEVKKDKQKFKVWESDRGYNNGEANPEMSAEKGE